MTFFFSSQLDQPVRIKSMLITTRYLLLRRGCDAIKPAVLIEFYLISSFPRRLLVKKNAVSLRRGVKTLRQKLLGYGRDDKICN